MRNYKEILFNINARLWMDAKSRAVFNLNKVTLFISKNVSVRVDWSVVDWKLLSGAPAGSEVMVDLVGNLISILVVNDELPCCSLPSK
ncbi:hypothetical protein [Ralstonia mannitolilytica]|uniref:hypothetical protein n=1 Tax=Ralstonia mannitolilytica TaxID=105219 RepID=UPI0005D8358F|nr:hypothetical protein [Ralstonia mannitolilytica]AJW43933.1 hypothetical protein TK49_03930 [Ralstonia mannitolilytica]CAJ0733409.1 hypothetical protein R76706_03246 [Ralstonia mannitolilytica]